MGNASFQFFGDFLKGKLLLNREAHGKRRGRGRI